MQLILLRPVKCLLVTGCLLGNSLILLAASQNNSTGINYAGGSVDCPCVIIWNYAPICYNWDGDTDQWCFIDPSNCAGRKYEVAISTANHTLYKSYDTCGNSNRAPVEVFKNDTSQNTSEDVYRALENRKLRVGVPFDSGDFMLDMSHGIDKVKGLSVDFLRDLEKQGGFTWEAQNVSNISLKRYPDSAYTACVHDVAIGLADLCVGDFWKIPYRILLTPMSTRFTEDMFHLIVPSKPYGLSDQYLQSLATPFRPFTMTAWFLIMGTIVFISSILIFMRIKYNYQEHPVEYDRHSFVYQLIYSTILNFSLGINAEVFMSERGHGFFQRLVIMGTTIFGVILRLAYTSSLAANLVTTDQRTAQFSSLLDIVNKGGNICVMSHLVNMFELTYADKLAENSVTALHITSSSALSPSLLRSYDNPDGICSALLITKNAFHHHRSEGRFCEFSLIDEVLLSIGVSYPVTVDIEQTVNVLISKAVEEGRFVQNQRDYFNKYNFWGNMATKCDGGNSIVIEAAGMDRHIQKSSQMGATELLGPIIIALLFTIAGFVVFIWIFYVKPCINEKSIDYRVRKEKSSAAKSFLIDEKNDFVLKHHLESCSALELIEIIDEKIVDNKKMIKAFDHLPETSLLVSIAFEQKCTITNKNRLYLESVRSIDLCNILRSSGESRELVESVLDEPRLINKVVDFLSKPEHQDLVSSWRNKQEIKMYNNSYHCESRSESICG